MTSSLPSVLISIPQGILDLGWGHPSERLHPLAAMQRAVDHMFDTTRFDALQYGAFQGFGPLLDSLASYLSHEPAYDMPVEPESLFMTGGASQALDMACTLFTRAGDTVFVEEPTYHLARNIFADHHLHARTSWPAPPQRRYQLTAHVTCRSGHQNHFSLLPPPVIRPGY